MTMNTDSLLQIYQTYSLEKINALSKKSLAIQYAQNGELVKLNKQLAANNAATNAILRNQIKELERQETVRFYKDLTFKIKLVLDKIESQPVTNFKLFLSSLFLKPIEAYAKEAIDKLEDIKDKEYAQVLIDRAKEIASSNKEHQLEYNQSAWSSYLSAKEASEDKKLHLDLLKKEYEIEKLDKANGSNTGDISNKKHYKGCLIVSLVFLVFMAIALIVSFVNKDPNATGGIPVVLVAVCLVLLSWYLRKRSYRNNENSKANNNGGNLDDKDKKLRKELDELKALDKGNKEHFAIISEAVKGECNNWEEQINEIIELLPHEVDPDDKKITKYDPVFEEAAKLIVINKSGSISLIQRKFAVGINRANQIMDQLESAGIVGPYNGNNVRQVLVSDESELAIILNELKV